MRALYERLIFQYLTYNLEKPCCNNKLIPVLFIMTSNVPDEAYQPGGFYHHLVEQYQSTFERFIGSTEVFIYGDTLQVSDYSKYNWTMFDPEHKKERHDAIFAFRLEEAKTAGKRMAER